MCIDDGDDDLSPPSLKYMQMGGAESDSMKPSAHLTSPLEARASVPPPLRLVTDHHQAHRPNFYLPPAGSGHSPLGRSSRLYPADSRLFFGAAAHDRFPSPPLPSRPYFLGFADVPLTSSNGRGTRVSRASPLMSPKNLTTTGLGGKDGQSQGHGSEPPAAKRLALEESRLFYPFSLPTAQLKIASRSKC